jgi:hypothetical protein
LRSSTAVPYLGRESNVAFDRTLFRNPYWWIEVAGTFVFMLAAFAMRSGSARLVLLLLGLGLMFLGAKTVYDQRREPKFRDYSLFPKDQRIL